MAVGFHATLIVGDETFIARTLAEQIGVRLEELVDGIGRPFILPNLDLPSEQKEQTNWKQTGF